MNCPRCGRFVRYTHPVIKSTVHQQRVCCCGWKSKPRKLRIRYGPPIISITQGVYDDLNRLFALQNDEGF